MSVRYSAANVVLETPQRALRTTLRVENRSGAAWTREKGFAIGYQIFDPDSHIFIEEGAWRSLDADVEPGESTSVDLSIHLPREKGRYYVYVSPVEEPGGWYYARGAPFLLIEAEVEGGVPRLVASRITTLAAMRFRKLHVQLRRTFTSPLESIWRNRSLIRSMVRRDVLGRYRGSFGGAFWTVLNPLLLMTTYYFVFGVVLQARFGNDPSRAGFVLYFLAGMLPWLAFSEPAGRSPYVILEHRNFVKKLLFPIETLPVVQTIAGLVTEAFALGIFIAFLFFSRGAVPASVLWLPVLLLAQLMFTLGISWFLAALGAFVRDLGQIMGFLLTLWFFLTPICYPEASLIPSGAIKILSKNPLFVLVRGYRDIFLEGRAPAWGSMWKLYLVSALVFWLGYAWFHKLRKTFADII
ncbi:MAG: ABC transporter permease [Acidobacteriales bacterium]|nr:ABC transporter permease [Terriglobales bacterium]